MHTEMAPAFCPQLCAHSIPYFWILEASTDLDEPSDASGGRGGHCIGPSFKRLCKWWEVLNTCMMLRLPGTETNSYYWTAWIRLRWFLWIVWNRSICLRLTRNRPVACIDNLRETGWSCVSRHITIHSNLANQIVISACKLQPSVTQSPLQQDTVRRQYVCNLPMYKEKKERKGQTKCPESFNTTNLISAAVLPHYIWAFLTLRCV